VKKSSGRAQRNTAHIIALFTCAISSALPGAGLAFVQPLSAKPRRDFSAKIQFTVSP
jgi:hypothetical protein